MLLRHHLQTIHKNKGIGEIKLKGRAEMKIIIATKVKKKKETKRGCKILFYV